MRSTEHFKRHLEVITGVDGKTIGTQPIEDPFLNTKVVVGWSFWDWLKMLFTRKREVLVTVHVRADGVAMKRWFNGTDVCERCEQTVIGYPHDGSNANNPGYHHGDERLCEKCYYGLPGPPATANSCDRATSVCN